MPQKCLIFKGFPVLDCFREDVILWQICGRWNKGLKQAGTICGGHLCGNHRGDKAKGGLLFLYSKMRRIYMDQRKNYTIKQIMPLPEGYEVMMEVAQQDGTKMMEAAKETLFPYCLVLLEGTMVTN